MDRLLVVTLVVVLLALTVAVIPLLLQLRRTAAAVEHLAVSATVDLKQVAEDVHATRTQIETLAARFQPGVAGAGGEGLFGLLNGVGLGRFGPLLSGLVGLLALFLKPKSTAGDPPEC